MAMLAVPDLLRERVMMALRSAQQLARQEFGPVLRVGLVRIGELTDQGYPVKLGKMRLSAHVT
jgi:hypothetical protein